MLTDDNLHLSTVKSHQRTPSHSTKLRSEYPETRSCQVTAKSAGSSKNRSPHAEGDRKNGFEEEFRVDREQSLEAAVQKSGSRSYK
jgi:hypothetical protein